MKKKIKQILIILNFILMFVLTSWSALKEESYKKRNYFYLEIAPVDPRSLMQGDYMILNHVIENKAWGKIHEMQLKDDRAIRKGYIVVKIDENKIAQFVDVVERIDKSDNKDLLFISFKTNGYAININANSFLFQEGEAKNYENSKYSKVVLVNNTLRLIDLKRELD